MPLVSLRASRCSPGRGSCSRPRRDDAVVPAPAARRAQRRSPTSAPRSATRCASRSRATALEALVARGGGRATIVVEPPALPIPASPNDPRQHRDRAPSSTSSSGSGSRPGYQTILVAGGLARRLVAARARDRSSRRELARRFHGHVVVHDVEDPELVDARRRVAAAAARQPRARRDRSRRRRDARRSRCCTAGRPRCSAPRAPTRCARPARTRCSRRPRRRAGISRSRSSARSPRRVPLIGVSLVLNHPETSGALRGYPYDPDGARARSRARRCATCSPRCRTVLRRDDPALVADARSRWRPRSAARRRSRTPRRCCARSSCAARELDEPLDAIVIGIPATTPYLPRERPNPLLAAYLGLGLALRLWRDAFPVVDGGTAILLNRFSRHFAHPTQQPYRAFFHATRIGPRPARCSPTPSAARRDGPRGRSTAYRAGPHACHPLLPFRDWNACQPALGRLGAVLVAGCRRRRRRAAARLRAGARRRRRARDGARPQGARARSASCSPAVLPAARRRRRRLDDAHREEVRGFDDDGIVDASSARTSRMRSVGAARSKSVTFAQSAS